jgi:hypothetical protein
VAFERLGCIACRSVGGRGNLTNSLDGVERRPDATALREWTLGAPTAAQTAKSAIAGPTKC